MPKYGLHKQSGQARVCLGGEQVLLGKYGSEESRKEYDRVVGAWIAAGRPKKRAKAIALHAVRVIDIAQKYFTTYIMEIYKDRTPNGEPAGTARNYKMLLWEFIGVHGDDYADTFGPKRLKEFRQRLVDRGMSRGEVNKRVNQLKAMFRWAASEEMIPVVVSQSLDSVINLQGGETKASEAGKVKLVALSDVEKTIPWLPPIVADMVRLEVLTGARPGEIVRMTPGEVDRSFEDGAWRYQPTRHKTQRYGVERTIYLGPPAQKVLAKYLENRAPDCPCFSPKEAEAMRRAAATAKRKTLLSCGNRAGTNRVVAPIKRPGDAYTTGTYRQAIERACKKAGVTRWTPNRIRHTVATMIRKKHGPIAAQVILGHKRLSTTEIYAEPNTELALSVVLAAG